MSASLEEQATECEALCSIYGEDFVLRACPAEAASLLSSAAIATSPEFCFSVRICPPATPCHVSLTAVFTLPSTYPESSPSLIFESEKGLDDDSRKELRSGAINLADDRKGEARCYEMVEWIREWLNEHNEQSGEGSAYDEMMKRQRLKEKQTTSNAPSVYSRDEDPSVSKASRAAASAKAADSSARKSDGTPVTRETFLAWRTAFEKEVAAEAKLKADEAAKAGIAIVDSSAPIDPLTGKLRLTGRMLFESDSTLATSDVAELDKVPSEDGEGGAAGAGVTQYVVDPSLYLADDVDDLDDEDFDPDDDEDDDEEDDDDEDGDGGFFDEDDS